MLPLLLSYHRLTAPGLLRKSACKPCKERLARSQGHRKELSSTERNTKILLQQLCFNLVACVSARDYKGFVSTKI
jgi:hypothetical protein